MPLQCAHLECKSVITEVSAQILLHTTKTLQNAVYQWLHYCISSSVGTTLHQHWLVVSMLF